MNAFHPFRFQFLLFILFLGSSGCGPNESHGQVDPEWMEDWDEAQEYRPSTLSSTGRIAPTDEPGTPVFVHGFVVEPDGHTPAEGVVVFGYQTDNTGVYFGPDNSHSTWRLQGWAETDAEGHFEFQTIRPAPYPSNSEGAHIHFTVETDDFGRQWDPTIYFSDDSLVTKAMRRDSEAEGVFGNVLDVETIDGVQHVDVVIRLKEEGDF